MIVAAPESNSVRTECEKGSPSQDYSKIREKAEYWNRGLKPNNLPSGRGLTKPALSIDALEARALTRT
jgi:hypothetical protein